MFHQLSSLSTDSVSISQNLKKVKTKTTSTEKSLPSAPSSPEPTSPTEQPVTSSKIFKVDGIILFYFKFYKKITN